MVVSVNTIAQDVFTAFETLIVANKPTYTKDGTGYTYSVVAKYPSTNPSFPLIVLNDSMVNLALLNHDGSGEDYDVEVQLDLYTKGDHGTKAIVAGKDSLRKTILGNRSSFDSNNGLIAKENFIEDSNVSAFQDKNQLVNTASMITRFKLK